MAMDRLSVAIPGDLLRRLRAYADREGMGFAEAARFVLDRGLTRGALPDESPEEEVRRLLLEQAREGSVQALVALSRLQARAPAAPSSRDEDDELASRRRRA